jgi:transposase
MGTRKKPLSPSNLSPEDARIDMKLPKNSYTVNFLVGDKKGDRRAIHVKLDEIVKIGVKKRNQEVEERWKEFCSFFLKYFPEEQSGIEKLWPYIFRRLMNKEDLNDEYFAYLKEKDTS